MNSNSLVETGSLVLNNELEKSLDQIILSWMARGFYTDMTEGQIRKSLSDLLVPMLEDIKLIESDIIDNQSFGLGDTDELMMELSRKKMAYIRKITELLKST